MNLSGSGLSWSVGPRGASINFGSRGTFLNTGIPGTGLYSRTALSGGSTPRSPRTPRATEEFTARVIVGDDGSITFNDEHGHPLAENRVAAVKRQQGQKIRDLIEKQCSQINGAIEALGKIHLYTPAPDQRIRYEPGEFEVPEPQRPIAKSHGFLSWLVKSVRNRIDAENAARQSSYETARRDWSKAKDTFLESESERKALLEEKVFSEIAAMETILERGLQAITWPRETSVSTEVDERGELVLLDVDLPEIEDLPKKTATALARGFKLNVKDISDGQRQRLYMQHVHAIGFRIIGEVFAILPKAMRVVLSAYSQRPNRSTGNIEDEYLYSVLVKRLDWQRINFANLAALDVVEALQSFELRRDMSKTGVFKPIDPIKIWT